MHDGSLATLEDVIEFYDGGGRPNPHIDPEIHPLRLTVEEKRALAAFLKSSPERSVRAYSSECDGRQVGGRSSLRNRT